MYFLIIGIIIVLIIFLSFFILHKKNHIGSQLEEAGEYYDMHTHILPGVDHGAADMDTAIAMIRREYEEGIHHIVLTPHYYSKATKKEDVLARFHELCKRVAQEQIPVKLYQGEEIACKGETIEDLDEDRALRIGNTSYVLMEFRPGDSFHYIKNCLDQVQMKGYRPIVAHIERYQALRDEDAVRELTAKGISIQVNAGSFTKKNDRKYLIGLAREGLIHVIGSDCHDLEKRPPGIMCAARILQKELPEEMYEKIFFKNPAAILNNQYLR